MKYLGCRLAHENIKQKLCSHVSSIGKTNTLKCSISIVEFAFSHVLSLNFPKKKSKLHHHFLLPPYYLLPHSNTVINNMQCIGEPVLELQGELLHAMLLFQTFSLSFFFVGTLRWKKLAQQTSHPNYRDCFHQYRSLMLHCTSSGVG
jgi:hypothetical protein